MYTYINKDSMGSIKMNRTIRMHSQKSIRRNAEFMNSNRAWFQRSLQLRPANSVAQPVFWVQIRVKRVFNSSLCDIKQAVKEQNDNLLNRKTKHTGKETQLAVLTSFGLDIKEVLITNLMFNTGAYISSNFKITAVVDGP